MRLSRASRSGSGMPVVSAIAASNSASEISMSSSESLSMDHSIGPLKSGEVWMLHRICLIAGIVSTLMFMTPAVAYDHGVQGHHGQRYGRVHAHGYYV